MASKATPSAKGYYQTIGGLRYDRAVLDAAKAAVAGPGDGHVSKADAKVILAHLFDGGNVTQIEYRTAFRVMHEFKFTDEAKALFVDTLAMYWF